MLGATLTRTRTMTWRMMMPGSTPVCWCALLLVEVSAADIGLRLAWQRQAAADGFGHKALGKSGSAHSLGHSRAGALAVIYLSAALKPLCTAGGPDRAREGGAP